MDDPLFRGCPKSGCMNYYLNQTKTYLSYRYRKEMYMGIRDRPQSGLIFMKIEIRKESEDNENELCSTDY